MVSPTGQEGAVLQEPRPGHFATRQAKEGSPGPGAFTSWSTKALAQIKTNEEKASTMEPARVNTGRNGSEGKLDPLPPLRNMKEQIKTNEEKASTMEPARVNTGRNGSEGTLDPLPPLRNMKEQIKTNEEKASAMEPARVNTGRNGSEGKLDPLPPLRNMKEQDEAFTKIII
ncbi:hypothetical protein NDU88_003975 [Pleurodeles waltl]|uniref:Uncharacterized protein n=1 Tax=Pleurodeles waltl TaxID=8319 RepID=A0AAV7T7H6_PLEWA|nr:hypothetical protein NDU88_003975 [Pleurodeles waltl]